MPARVQLIAEWQSVLPGFDATAHMLSSHAVTLAPDGASALCISHVHAMHVLEGVEGGNTWDVYGTYTHRLVRAGAAAGGRSPWLITAMRLDVRSQRGNKALLVAGATRAAMLAAAAADARERTTSV